MTQTPRPNSEHMAFDTYWGLTKREWFAGKAMEGLLAGDPNNHECWEHTGAMARMHADAALDALAQDTNEGDGDATANEHS